MEDRMLNEKESLALISQMILNTKKNVRQNAGVPALLWGYATILTSLAVYAGVVLLQQQWVMLGWLLIPILGGVGMLWLSRREKPVMTKTYLDRVIKYIWLIMGLVCFGVSAAAFIYNIPILFFVSLLMSASITLTGCVADYKVYVYFGIAGIILSFLCLVVRAPEQILVFAANFVVMMIIPSHMLNAENRKNECK
ncbi:hypothetical protein [Bacteroides reticulotermitis]|uniref:hypothetical protein n=1 Tax=Bacteroides reticulotermitis TaxID=1133319 RepID=UPI003A8A496C